jgi:hypothetical protein
VRDGGAVLRVEVGVDLVEEVEGRRVALLDGEDERERAQAWSESSAEASEGGDWETHSSARR